MGVGVPIMTTLYNLSINSVDCKSVCINFEIKKKIFYPSSFKGKFVSSGLASLVTVAVNQAVSIQYTDSVGSYYVFSGVVTKLTPDGIYTTVEANSGMTKLFTFYSTYDWVSATNHDAIMEDLLDSTAGPSLTVTNNVSTHNSISFYQIENQPVINVLRKLNLMSADGASEELSMVRQSDSSSTSVDLS